MVSSGFSTGQYLGAVGLWSNRVSVFSLVVNTSSSMSNDLGTDTVKFNFHEVYSMQLGDDPLVSLMLLHRHGLQDYHGIVIGLISGSAMLVLLYHPKKEQFSSFPLFERISVHIAMVGSFPVQLCRFSEHR